ncbi:hypothetical protein JRQ81_010160 [Phrynocephalus forsythii]|uniref:Transmembrane protein 238 n=1 Tax=Phrynocephalus forsythii TaxID=171643 RepID=A0A9Q0X842_9SAUR|nr:hypothetical protein JRQ81_010160 [Phrynocephalus forsythii]
MAGVGRRRGAGRCRAALWLALLLDGAGVASLLSGVLADVFFADLLIYGGGVGIFFSLLGWVFWYVGNLEVPPGELQDDVGRGGGGIGIGGHPKEEGGRRLATRLARSLSARFSGTLCARGPPTARPQAAKQGPEDGAAAAAAATLEEQEREGDLVEGSL